MEDFQNYYHNGIQNKWLKEWKDMEMFRPQVPSVTPELGKKISQYKKRVFVSPLKSGKSYRFNRELNIHFTQHFWVALLERLISEGITPVVWQNYATYDISMIFGEKCVYVTDRNISNVMGAMRATGLVLDPFTGLNRMAIAARTPFVACDERTRYMSTKDYEVTDLCAHKLPHRYIFSFSTIIENERYHEIIENIINVLKSSLSGFDYEVLPSTSESYEPVSYDVVRQHKAKRIGARFIKVERLVIS